MMKGKLEELGEEVSSDVDTISKVQTQILNLTKGKVNIFDPNGNFRDYYKIMSDIAKVYDDLSSTDQANLQEILFGKMRGNQGAALISAFQSGQVDKALETALGSEGSAQKEMDKWLESVTAKTQQFKAAWEGLSNTFLSSDFLKLAIDSGTGLITVLDKIIEMFGALPVVLAGTGIAGFIKNFDWLNQSYNIAQKMFIGLLWGRNYHIGDNIQFHKK